MVSTTLATLQLGKKYPVDSNERQEREFLKEYFVYNWRILKLNTVQYEIQSDTLPNSPEIISVVSGKGGVGKTLTTIHLAFSWQNAGKEVLIVDGDLGLANVDVVLGLHPKRNISDVLERGATIEDVTLEGPFGVKILPAGSGITDLANLSNVKRHLLSSELKKYLRNFDSFGR